VPLAKRNYALSVGVAVEISTEKYVCVVAARCSADKTAVVSVKRYAERGDEQ
jgi:hypothetical protein